MHALSTAEPYEVANQAPAEVMVSVLILTYNQAHYIAAALDGVLAQRVSFELEICIGEDGSSDGTRDICMEYAQRYPDRIRLFLRDRDRVAGLTGYEAAMLNGTETRDACRGRYIAICDGDDYWTDPAKLQMQVDYLEAHPECSFCFHPVQQLWPDGTFTDKPRAQHRHGDGLLAARSVLLGGGQYVPTSATVYRRSALYQDLPDFLPTAVVGDLPTQVILASRGEIMFFARPMSVYRRHAPGSWSDTHRQAAARTQHFSKMLRLWDQLVDFLPWRLKGFAHLRAAYETYKFALVSAPEQVNLQVALGKPAAVAAAWLHRVAFHFGRLLRVFGVR